ncbi:MAG: hypothetical protein J5I59_13035 [Saprospiraceae bacterium]|nr:hypothetical protein [Saprospiraceae bacterium]
MINYTKAHKNILTLSMLLLLLSACKTSTKTAETPKGELPAVRKYFTIDNGACFGRCAVYEITFQSDSTLRMNGKTYVNYQGHYFKKLTGGQFDTLMDLYKAVKLDTFGNTYTNNIVDLAAVTYYFFDEYNAVKKKIFTQGVYPPPLSDLSSAMRMYISKLGWEHDHNAETVNPDEVIIQVKEGKNVQDIIDENWRYKLFIKAELSKSGIYLLGFDKTTIEQNQLINLLKRQDGVLLVQTNNKVELRR